MVQQGGDNESSLRRHRGHKSCDEPGAQYAGVTLLEHLIPKWWPSDQELVDRAVETL